MTYVLANASLGRHFAGLGGAGGSNVVGVDINVKAVEVTSAQDTDGAAVTAGTVSTGVEVTSPNANVTADNERAVVVLDSSTDVEVE